MRLDFSQWKDGARFGLHALLLIVAGAPSINGKNTYIHGMYMVKIQSSLCLSFFWIGQCVNYSLLMPSGFGKCSNYLSFLLQLDFAMNTCKGLPSNSKIFCFLLASPDLQVPMIPLVSFEPSFPICLLLWKWRENIILLQNPGATRNNPSPPPQVKCLREQPCWETSTHFSSMSSKGLLSEKFSIFKTVRQRTKIRGIDILTHLLL